MADTTSSYMAIDLKSFYASVECMQRGLDPLTTNLVVADVSRTEKTICLAVSPALKKYGIPGRARLFEVIQKVREINNRRKRCAPKSQFSGESFDENELAAHPELSVGFIAAKPQMAKYMEMSAQIYEIYLKYIAPEDIHVYSIDEVFIDATKYLKTYQISTHELALRMIRDVLQTTGITATAGIGTNLYLCKVAMDIVAKHAEADADGVRLAELDEMTYRRLLWGHRPLTDFWRVGPGYARRLAQHGLFTMGDIARCSVENDEFLYQLFGVNAELLIDHAWGWEPCAIADIKAYKPASNSIGSGQVLTCGYPAAKARLVVREMADLLALELVEKRLVTDQMVLTIGYDVDNLRKDDPKKHYTGPVQMDRYGRKIPKPAHGTVHMERQTSSAKQIIEAVMGLFDRIANPELLVRRINLAADHVVEESRANIAPPSEQLDLFTDYAAREKKQKEEEAALAREKKRQQAILDIRKKFGKNAIFKGMNLEEGATARERNGMIGGHKA